MEQQYIIYPNLSQHTEITYIICPGRARKSQLEKDGGMRDVEIVDVPVGL